MLSVDTDVRRLGDALDARAGRVAERMVALLVEAGRRVDAAAERRAAEAAEIATGCVAGWLADGGRQSPASAARECAQAFAQLADAPAARLREISERCLLWRDATAELVHEIAGEMGLDSRARARALVMLRESVNTALLSVCERFESAQVIAERELSFAVSHDRLTGLPSRGVLMEEMKRMRDETSQTGGLVGVLVLDLDDFQAVNDRAGYVAGDELLRQLAQRLLGVAGPAASVARLGGDEFAVALIQPDREAVEVTAERLLEAVRGPYVLGEQAGPVSVRTSIGVAVDGVASVEELLGHAATAMHHAKLSGRDRWACFAPQMRARAQSIDLEIQLREAVAGEQLRLLYQPVFSLGDPIVATGVEALVRWQHPDRGLIAPAEFIAMAEQTGMIVDVGRWVLQRACEQCAGWHRAGLPMNVGVNVSARQLDGTRLIEEVRHALISSGLAPHALVIEVTETAAMRDIELSTRVLSTLKQAGVRVAIDDFGTGYSSLAHLQRLPIDTLKIDRSFISRASVDGPGEVLLRTLAQLGDSLGMTTLAEGIETLSQLQTLQAMGYAKGQGFLLARPMEAEALPRFLAEHSSRHPTRASSG